MTFEQLVQETAKFTWVRSGSFADRISYIVDSGRVNADDTVYTEKAAPASDYDRIALETVIGTLAYETDKRVINWFAKRGIRA